MYEPSHRAGGRRAAGAQVDRADQSGDLDGRRRRARVDPSKTYEERRQLLLRAGELVFREVGLRAARMSDIAEKAGVDRGTAYYYFSNSDELFFELLDRAMREHEAVVGELSEGDLDAPEQLRAIIVAMVLVNHRNHPVTHIYAFEDLSRLDIDDELQRTLASTAQRTFERLRSVVARGQREGSIRCSLSAGEIAQTVFGLISWPGRWHENGDEARAREIGEGLAGMVVDGLCQRGVDGAGEPR